jgi:hypothetical protein
LAFLILIYKIGDVTPIFGDHVVVVFDHKVSIKEEIQTLRKNWKSYNKGILLFAPESNTVVV